MKVDAKIAAFNAKRPSTRGRRRGTVAVMSDPYVPDVEHVPGYVETYSRPPKRARKTGWERSVDVSTDILGWAAGIGLVLVMMVTPTKS